MSNTVAQKPKFSVAIQTDAYKKLINNTLQDPKRAQRFIASISSAVAVNPALQECDAGTVLSGALLGESLNLSPSPQLGQYYLVPFERKAKYDNNGNMISPEMKIATFILGYKGYKMLAMRSGQYRRMGVVPVKKGEFISYDPYTGEFEARPMTDPLQREAAETVGYYGFYELLNGYRETEYWPKEKMIQHATRYSPAFGEASAKGRFPGRVSYDHYLAGKYNKNDEWAYASFWYKDFDGMAIKTMYRQMLSKAPMSIEMQQAFEFDDKIVHQNSTTNYFTGEDMEQPLQGIHDAVNDEYSDSNESSFAAETEQQTISMSDL